MISRSGKSEFTDTILFFEIERDKMSRAREMCKHISKSGQECALYLGHQGDHKSNHLMSSWSDDE